MEAYLEPFNKLEASIDNCIVLSIESAILIASKVRGGFKNKEAAMDLHNGGVDVAAGIMDVIRCFGQLETNNEAILGAKVVFFSKQVVVILWAHHICCCVVVKIF